jgi:pyridoxal phosphate enzyme (YggS family)
MNVLNEIQKQIQSADHRKVGPTLIAVSKLQSLEKIRNLYDQGQRHFGENYVQEALSKLDQLQSLGIIWHFIGSLQKNKVKHVVGLFEYIHSVDSLALAEIIDRKAQEKKITQKIFLQLNLASEDSKGGFSVSEFEDVWPKLHELQNIQICGLMTMPPLTNNADQNRPYFSQLRQIQQKTQLHFPSCQFLSMGTSSDFLVAIEEGSHFIRLGTVLFGARPKK